MAVMPSDIQSTVILSEAYAEKSKDPCGISDRLSHGIPRLRSE